MIVGLEDILRIVAGPAFPSAHIFEHPLPIETPRILGVESVGDIGYRKDSVAGFERHRHGPLEIDGGYLLAFPKVANRRLAQRRVDLEGHARTGAAAIEAQHESGPLGRAAINVGKDAEASPPTAQQRLASSG